MGSRNVKAPCRFAVSALVACCALSVVMSGCERKSEAQKAPVASQAPVAPVAPLAPIVPDAKLAKKYVGKYLNKKYPNDFTELKSDGTFVYKEGEQSLTGKYYIEATRLLLTLPGGAGSVCKIDDKGITDTNGELWKRP